MKSKQQPPKPRAVGAIITPELRLERAMRLAHLLLHDKQETSFCFSQTAFEALEDIESAFRRLGCRVERQPDGALRVFRAVVLQS